MKRILPFLVIASLLLTACGTLFPAPANPTPSNDQIETRMAQLLTSMPTATQAATQLQAQPTLEPHTVWTDTPAPQPTATETVPPADTSTPTVEPTPTIITTQTGGMPAEMPPATPEGTIDPNQQMGGGGPTDTPMPGNQTGGGAPASGAPATPTAPPTVMPQGGGVPASVQPPAQLGQADFHDPMDNGNNWPTGVDAKGFTTISFQNSKMLLTGLKTTGGWRLSSYGTQLRDFYIQMTFTTPQCQTSDRYGIYFRVPSPSQNDQGYWFQFDCQGQYALQKWDSLAGDKGEVTNLVYWSKSNAINFGPNATNVMGVMAVGKRIWVYANGQLLRAQPVEDTSFMQGAFGPMVGGRVTTPMTIQVDDLYVWTHPTAP